MPIYSFWCIPFERFNGVFGSFPFNNQNIAATVLKKFEDYINSNLESADVHILLKVMYQEVNSILPQNVDNIYINLITYSTYHELSNPMGMHHVADVLRLASNIFHLQKPLYEFVIGADILPMLADMYRAVFSDAGCLVTVHQLTVRSNKVSFFNRIINSKLCKSERGTCIIEYQRTVRTQFVHAHPGLLLAW